MQQLQIKQPSYEMGKWHEQVFFKRLIQVQTHTQKNT